MRSFAEGIRPTGVINTDGRRTDDFRRVLVVRCRSPSRLAFGGSVRIGTVGGATGKGGVTHCLSTGPSAAFPVSFRQLASNSSVNQGFFASF